MNRRELHLWKKDKVTRILLEDAARIRRNLTRTLNNPPLSDGIDQVALEAAKARGALDVIESLLRFEFFEGTEDDEQ